MARVAHHLAYREIVERQFGAWDEREQDDFFAADWGGAAFEVLLWHGVPCGYTAVESRAEDVHVRELVVVPEYQGLGVGTRVLQSAIAAARARRVPVHLGTFRESPALALYRRLGFEEIDRTTNHVLLRFPRDGLG